MKNGYAIADLVLTASACERIADELPDAAARRGGVRGLIASPIVARVVKDARFVRALCEVVDLPLVAVKATLFDKTPESNWRVQWHQDRVFKDGTTQVEPATEVLERMIAARIHLDDCGAENGPLRVIPGSHRNGKLSADEIASVVAMNAQVELLVPQGAILFMRPLLVHASSPAISATHRRVLHIEFAPPDVIAPLGWRDHVPLSL